MSLGLLVSCMQPPRKGEHFAAASGWWASQVVCVGVEEVPHMGGETEEVRFYALANGHGERYLKVSNIALTGPPLDFLAKYLDRPIVAFMETRQHFWSFQPDNWITYHVATALEVDGHGTDKLFILCERVDDRLELMLGVGYIPRSFMLEFRATGKARRAEKCFRQPRRTVAPRVTVRRFFDWLGNSVAPRWQPYHILQSNCQHVAEKLQRFISDPNSSDPDFSTVDPHAVLLGGAPALVARGPQGRPAVPLALASSRPHHPPGGRLLQKRSPGQPQEVVLDARGRIVPIEPKIVHARSSGAVDDSCAIQ